MELSLSQGPEFAPPLNNARSGKSQGMWTAQINVAVAHGSLHSIDSSVDDMNYHFAEVPSDGDICFDPQMP